MPSVLSFRITRKLMENLSQLYRRKTWCASTVNPTDLLSSRAGREIITRPNSKLIKTDGYFSHVWGCQAKQGFVKEIFFLLFLKAAIFVSRKTVTNCWQWSRKKSEAQSASGNNYPKEGF